MCRFNHKTSYNLCPKKNANQMLVSCHTFSVIAKLTMFGSFEKKSADIIVSGVLSVSLLFHFISYNKEQVNISLIDCLVNGPVFIFRIQLSSQSWFFFFEWRHNSCCWARVQRRQNKL